MQLSGNYDSALKAGVYGMTAGAAIGTASHLYTQNKIIKNPKIGELLKDIYNQANNQKAAAQIDELILSGKVNYKNAAKNAGKTGLIIGGICAAANLLYNAIKSPNKDEA